MKRLENEYEIYLDLAAQLRYTPHWIDNAIQWKWQLGNYIGSMDYYQSTGLLFPEDLTQLSKEQLKQYSRDLLEESRVSPPAPVPTPRASSPSR